jgi:hypothetical protein
VIIFLIQNLLSERYENHEEILCVISGFRRKVAESCATGCVTTQKIVVLKKEYEAF